MAWYNKLGFGNAGRAELELLEKGGMAKGSERLDAAKHWDLDPQDWNFAYTETDIAEAYHPGTLGLDFHTLRAMARVPVISAIIQTRVGQVAEFAVPCVDPYSIGYRLRLRDPDKKPSAKQKTEMREIADWLLTCGDERVSGTTSFDHFIRMIVRDSLVFDQACFEIVKTKGGNIAGFVAVDASTIRRSRTTESERKSGKRTTSASGFVQILNDKTVATFDEEELVFGIRRPRTWIKIQGYGYPELEELVRVITNLVNAENFNASNFTHGMHVAGILAVKSKMNPQLFRAFRREFYAMLSGAHNAKKTPLIQLDPENKEELQAINMSKSNTDMEFSQWMSWLLKLATSIYGMDPAELNYIYGPEGQSHQLNQKSPMDRILASKERGLRPLIRSVERWLNRGLIQKMYPEYRLEFVGFDAKSEDAKLEFDIKTVKAFRTINEVRAMYDMEPIESPVADMILDPTYINTAWQMSMNDQGGGPEGEGGPEGGPEGEGGEEDFDLDSLLSDAGVAGDAPEPEEAEAPPPEVQANEAIGKALRRNVQVEVK
jgi:hypothetical protein